MKHIIFLSFLVSSLFSLTINDSILKIHATLVPKISLMDYNYKEKCIDNKITIDIVYEKINYLSALSLKEMIDKKYNNGINSYTIETKLITYNQLNEKAANIYYLFPSNKGNIKKAIEIANKYEGLTFSYLKDTLKYGVMMSLNIGTQVKPILNLNAIKESNITFRPVLLDISTVYINNKEGVFDDLEGFRNHKIYVAKIKSFKKVFLANENK